MADAAPREQQCPRCLSIADHSPDDKECSDRCITRHQRTIAALACRIDAYDSDLQALRARQQALEQGIREATERYRERANGAVHRQYNSLAWAAIGFELNRVAAELDALLTPRPSVTQEKA